MRNFLERVQLGEFLVLERALVEIEEGLELKAENYYACVELVAVHELVKVRA
jgi:hypothetical protein